MLTSPLYLSPPPSPHFFPFSELFFSSFLLYHPVWFSISHLFFYTSHDFFSFSTLLLFSFPSPVLPSPSCPLYLVSLPIHFHKRDADCAVAWCWCWGWSEAAWYIHVCEREREWVWKRERKSVCSRELSLLRWIWSGGREEETHRPKHYSDWWLPIKGPLCLHHGNKEKQRLGWKEVKTAKKGERGGRNK